VGRALRLPALAGVVALLVGLWPVEGLEIENAARGGKWRLALPSGGAFALTSHHSMYQQPYTERFAVDGEGRIRLREVWSKSAAVREYLGLTGPGERQVVSRLLPELVVRVAVDRPQELEVGGTVRSLLGYGAHGDRLVLRAVRRPVLARLLPGGP
jgi:hypothetical protein